MALHSTTPDPRLRRAAAIATFAAGVLAACLHPHGPAKPAGPPLPSPATEAERTAYRETSTDSDVNAFLSRLARRTGRIDSVGQHDTTLAAGPFELAAFDSSTSGPLIPFVIASRPTALTPQQAHREGRPIVFIEAGATGPEDGTDALLALVRELVTAPPSAPNALDSIVLIALPLASPDDARRARTVATDALVRDTAAPPHAVPDSDLVIATRRETRTTFAILHAWRPDVVIDLRNADGGGAGYPLTLAPPSNPAAFFAGAYTADALIPSLTRRLDEHHHLDTFACGTITPRVTHANDTTQHEYVGCDHRARSLINYAGLRNRVGVLARTNAADSLSARVAAATAFFGETLSLVAARRSEIVSRTAIADSAIQAWGLDTDSSPDIPLRAELSATGGAVPMLVTTSDGPSHTRPKLMPVRIRLETTLRRRLPTAYVLDPHDTATVHRLERHGIIVQRHLSAQRIEIIERFVIDSATVGSAAHDADHPARVFGRWLRVIATASLPAGTYTVPTSQPLGVLAMCLLEPESEDGFITWHHFDSALHAGGTYPVAKLIY